MAGVCPDFFIAGAPRCGTTSLSYYLRGHPEVCFSSPKETHFFISSSLEERLARDPQRHYIERFFPHYDAEQHRALGEGSVTYLYFPHVFDRILGLNPNARFIVMLRNPMKLVPSFHARMLYVFEEDTEDFAEAWGLQEARLRGERIPPHGLMPLLLQYAEIGSLGKYVSELFKRVPRSQCLLVLHDDLVANTARVYQSVLEFLELEHDGRSEFQIELPARGYRYRWLQRLLYKPPGSVLNFVGDNDVHKSRLFGMIKKARKRLVAYNTVEGCGTAPLSDEMLAVLRDTFRSDSELLGELVGRDLSHWYDDAAAGTELVV